jgi:hypothetical protein
MKVWSILVFAALCAPGFAQNPPVDSPLLEHLAGKWVAQVSIGGRARTDDISAEWVLQHHYLRLHEVSRNKDANGNPHYEAMIFIGERPRTKQISCLWLDVYGGTDIRSIGVAESDENEIHFIFKDESGSTDFSNDFLYDPKADTWEWRLDNVDHGKLIPFGTEKLVRVVAGGK